MVPKSTVRDSSAGLSCRSRPLGFVVDGAKEGGEAGMGGGRRRLPSQGAETTFLHKVVRANLATFVAEAGGVPRFVVQELEKYLACGLVSEGFTVLRRTRCGQEVAVVFSCQRRNCPSCVTHRMHTPLRQAPGRLGTLARPGGASTAGRGVPAPRPPAVRGRR